MPKVTGWDIYKSLDNNLKKKFVLITGGYIDYEKEKEIIEENIKIIYKPFDLNQLMDTLKIIFKKDGESE
jgi:DNA-binding NtrC family response regulator